MSASGVATGADLARIEVLRGTFASYLGDSEAQSLLVDALAVANRLEVPVDRIVVNGWCSLAASRAQRQDHVGARDAGATARRLADATGDPVLVGLANDVVGYVASYAGDHAAALEAHLAGLATVRRAGHEYDVVNLLNAVTEDLVGLGRADEAVVMSEEAFDLVRRGNSRPLLAAVLTMRGLALVSAMRVPEATGCLTEALRLGRDHLPDPFQQSSRLALLAVCSAAARDDASAARLWGAAEAQIVDFGTSIRDVLPQALGTEVDGARERIGAAFLIRAAAGAASPAAVIDALLDHHGGAVSSRA